MAQCKKAHDSTIDLSEWSFDSIELKLRVSDQIKKAIAKAIENTLEDEPPDIRLSPHPGDAVGKVMVLLPFGKSEDYVWSTTLSYMVTEIIESAMENEEVVSVARGLAAHLRELANHISLVLSAKDNQNV